MVRRKSIAVIGGSNNLVGIGQGDYIDSHDVVLRINLHWPCPIFHEPQQDVTCDIGQRTDILFQAIAAWRPERFFSMSPQLVMIRGDKDFLVNFVTPHHPYHWLYPKYQQILEDCESKGVEVEHFHPNYGHLYPTWNPNTGLLALKTVMFENPSKVYVVGFDFSTTHNQAINWTNHDPGHDREYFRKHIAIDPRVELHPLVDEAKDSNYTYVRHRNKIKI